MRYRIHETTKYRSIIYWVYEGKNVICECLDKEDAVKIKTALERMNGN